MHQVLNFNSQIGDFRLVCFTNSNGVGLFQHRFICHFMEYNTVYSCSIICRGLIESSDWSNMWSYLVEEFCWIVSSLGKKQHHYSVTIKVSLSLLKFQYFMQGQIMLNSIIISSKIKSKRKRLNPYVTLKIK